MRLRISGIVLVIIAFWVVLGWIAPRAIHFELALIAMILLPLLYRRGRSIWPSAAVLAITSMAFALTPFDLRFQNTGHAQIAILPVSHGPGCEPGTACYGCVVLPGDPRYAIVISLQ